MSISFESNNKKQQPNTLVENILLSGATASLIALMSFLATNNFQSNNSTNNNKVEGSSKKHNFVLESDRISQARRSIILQESGLGNEPEIKKANINIGYKVCDYVSELLSKSNLDLSKTSVIVRLVPLFSSEFHVTKYQNGENQVFIIPFSLKHSDGFSSKIESIIPEEELLQQF
jgi:hypothetical protein